MTGILKKEDSELSLRELKISPTNVRDFFFLLFTRVLLVNPLKLGLCANVLFTLEQEKKGHSQKVKFSSLKKETIILTKYYS